MFIKPYSLGEDTLCSQKNNTDEKEKGFASAQFVGLMALSIVLLATFVNVFTIEYMRNSSFAAVREAARAGTQVVDLGRVYKTPDAQLATSACQESLKASVNDLFSANESDYTYSCEIIEDDSVAPARYSMKASIEPKTIRMVPWAVAFKSRLKNISATYEQRQTGDSNSVDDIELPDDNDDCVGEDGCEVTP